MAPTRHAPRTPAVVERRPVAAPRAPVAERATSAVAGMRQRLGNEGAQALATQVMRSADGCCSPGDIVGPRDEDGLTLSQPGDALEREADRVAEKVMRVADERTGPPSVTPSVRGDVHRMCSECEEDMEVQRAASSGGGTVSEAVAANIHAMRGGGSPLPAETRDFFEQRFGSDFGHVRVHTGGRAETTAKAVSAKAFTIGSDIVFANGQYAPESEEGKHLLAHELTHVVQQDGRALKRSVVQRDIFDDLGEKFDEATDKAADIASDVADTASDIASDVADTASSVAGRVIEELEGTLDAAIGQITRTWTTLQRGVNEAIDGGIAKTLEFLSSVGATVARLGNALAAVDVDALRAAWNVVTGTVDAALAGVRGIVRQATETVDGLWSGLKGLADGLVQGVRSRANALIAGLPGFAQGTARGLWQPIEARLIGAWTTIESGWTQFRAAALERVTRVVDKVAAIAGSIKASVIGTIIDTLERLRAMFAFVMKLIADPGIIIDPLVREIELRLQPLPEKSRAFVEQKANETRGGGAVPAPAAGAKASGVVAPMLQRQAADAPARSTLGLGAIVSGCWDALADKLAGLWAKLGETIKEMVLSLVWPPATWAALKKDWATMVEELGKRAKRWEDIRTDSWEAFGDSLQRYLSNLADYPLIVWRAINAVLGHLSVYIGLAIVFLGGVAGAIAVGTGGAVFGSVVPVAGTAAGAGMGIGAGFLAGASAGWAVAETVGLIMLASFFLAEQASILKALNDLRNVPQSEEEQREDFGQVADSTIAIVIALLLMGIAFVGMAIAKRVWAFLKSIPARLRPKPTVVDAEPPGVKPVDPPVSASDRIVICRACVELKLVPPDLVARRAALSPEMQLYFDQKLGKFIKDPLNPTPAEFNKFKGMLDGIEKANGGDLEAGLKASKAREAGPAAKPPTGDPASIAKLPALRKAALDLLADIEALANKSGEPAATGLRRMAKRLNNDVEGILTKMENGAAEVTPERIEGFENNLKGIDTEFQTAKTSPPGTQFGVKKGGQEIDRITPDGKRWINDKGGNRFGETDPRVAEMEAQAKANMQTAQLPEHLVDGKPPEIEFHFPKGVTPEAAAKLRKVTVGGQSLIVTGPEIPL